MKTGRVTLKNLQILTDKDCQIPAHVDVKRHWIGIGSVTVYLAPLDSLPPGGQDIPGYLAPHPGYLHPWGARCPGRFILPPAKNKKTFFLTFCNFSAKQQEINIILQSFKEKIMSDLHFGGIDYWGQAVQDGLSCPPSEY